MGEEGVIHRTTGSLLLSPVSDIVGVPLDQVGSLHLAMGITLSEYRLRRRKFWNLLNFPKVLFVGFDPDVLWPFSYCGDNHCHKMVTIQVCFLTVVYGIGYDAS